MFTASRKQIYIPLSNQDDDEESLFAGLRLPSKSTLLSGLCIILALFASFIAGTMYPSRNPFGLQFALYSDSKSDEAPSLLLNEDGLARRIPLRAIVGEVTPNLPLSREAVQQKAEAGEKEGGGVWNELIPAGLGYFKEDWALPNSSVVIPAAFHQLHCLGTLRRAYYAQLGGDSSEGVRGEGESNDVADCFDYLAQSIVCLADSTVEPMDPDSGKLSSGFRRQCWDLEALREYVEDRKVSGAEGI
ncbi:hypothetical protein BJY01DRAFT_204106 [Aspergillus pseudoustus]|uniref:Uncharacterized protein n=1 Tax=Aspergillus pseudoustus TaxID=1810923 RepID=A0ABR4KSZ5_9EURO